MRKNLPILDEPLNADERMLHGIAIRLERIIDLLENIIEEKEEKKIEEIKFKSVQNIVDEITSEVIKEEVKVPKIRKKKGE